MRQFPLTSQTPAVGVNECVVNECGYGAMWWTGIPSAVHSPGTRSRSNMILIRIKHLKEWMNDRQHTEIVNNLIFALDVHSHLIIATKKTLTLVFIHLHRVCTMCTFIFCLYAYMCIFSSLSLAPSLSLLFSIPLFHLLSLSHTDTPSFVPNSGPNLCGPVKSTRP